MLKFVAVALVSYLLGSIPAGYLAGRIAGIDIRKVGSGNIGATNVTRTLGRRYGYPVFLVDFAKGALAVCVSVLLGWHVEPKPRSSEIYGIVGAVFCVLGHVFPVWLRLKGGKGVATSAGALFGLMPLAALIGVAVWVLTFEVTRYVSVASVTAAVIDIPTGWSYSTSLFAWLRSWSFAIAPISLVWCKAPNHDSSEGENRQNRYHWSG
ncbi:MAG: acyl-phosphate glycerol 3-phosphate acyltransferase [Verrucomicrobia bacterium]|nr:MAG: acyl-phosphate glycerol 3-phosphate acyltransferase [Verrucomicrobiota bacterium]